MRSSKVRRQRRVPGGRDQRSAGLESRIEKALEDCSSHLGVSVPLIISTALADFFGIRLDVEDRCDSRPRLLRKTGS